jgi:hypothetical protein
MATQFATQVHTTTNPMYGAPQQPSPVNSVTATPTNVSPTSPRTPNPFLQHQLPLATRQLRPPKSPLYVPAVLRPTERPSKQSSPMTPPRSVSGSMDSIHEEENSQGISRRSTGDSKNGMNYAAEDAWRIEEEFGEVTGLPTREHWKVRYNLNSVQFTGTSHFEATRYEMLSGTRSVYKLENMFRRAELGGILPFLNLAELSHSCAGHLGGLGYPHKQSTLQMTCSRTTNPSQPLSYP